MSACVLQWIWPPFPPKSPSHSRSDPIPDRPPLRLAGEALLRAGLLYLPDLDLYLAKVGGCYSGWASG